MIMARHALARVDALVARGELEAAARLELADVGAVELLPRRLMVELGRLPGLAPARELGLRDEHVGAPPLQVDAHAVAGLQKREPAAHGGLGRGVEDGGAAGGAALPPVADAGQ